MYCFVTLLYRCHTILVDSNLTLSQLITIKKIYVICFFYFNFWTKFVIALYWFFSQILSILLLRWHNITCICMRLCSSNLNTIKRLIILFTCLNFLWMCFRQQEKEKIICENLFQNTFSSTSLISINLDKNLQTL